MEKMRVAGLQLNLKWEDPEANRRHIAGMLAGYEGKADLIILPEMFTTGFTMNSKANAETVPGASMQWMRKLASRMKAYVMGSIIARQDGKYYNRLLVMNSSGLVMQYDKRHLFRMAGEHQHYAAGDSVGVFELKGWKICPLVCYDLRFPVWSRNKLGQNGKLAYDLLIYVANWPQARVSHWEALIKARAIENQAYAIGVNRVGVDGNDIPYSGSSMIVDILGNEQAFDSGSETILTAELDKSALERYRRKFPAWRDADNFSIS